MPPEYTKGSAPFCGRDFIINQNVLIPRLETEEIISLVPPAKLIADVGTGCGCIGITLAERYPYSTVYISDISEKALEVARKNIKTPNIKVIKSNLLTSYPPNYLFDVIVANLPYIPTERIPRLLAAVRRYEPHLALDGGSRGVTIINRLLKQLPKHLRPGGLAILEIDDTHILKGFDIPKGFSGEIKKDQFGRNRFLVLRRKL